MMRKRIHIYIWWWCSQQKTLICELSQAALFPPYPDDASYQWNGSQWGSNPTCTMHYTILCNVHHSLFYSKLNHIVLNWSRPLRWLLLSLLISTFTFFLNFLNCAMLFMLKQEHWNRLLSCSDEMTFTFAFDFRFHFSLNWIVLCCTYSVNWWNYFDFHFHFFSEQNYRTVLTQWIEADRRPQRDDFNFCFWFPLFSYLNHIELCCNTVILSELKQTALLQR